MGALALPRHQSRLLREEALSEACNGGNQLLHSDSGGARDKMNFIRFLKSGFNLSWFCWIREIHLVDHQPARLDGRLSDIPGCRFDHPKDEVSAGRLLARTPPPLALDRVGGVANTCGVEHRYGIAAEIKMDLQHVAG